MLTGPQGMSIDGNAASAAAATAAAIYAANAAAAASAAATSAATVADKSKISASSLIFRGVKWCFYLVLGASAAANYAAAAATAI